MVGGGLRRHASAAATGEQVVSTRTCPTVMTAEAADEDERLPAGPSTGVKETATRRRVSAAGWRYNERQRATRTAVLPADAPCGARTRSVRSGK